MNSSTPQPKRPTRSGKKLGEKRGRNTGGLGGRNAARRRNEINVLFLSTAQEGGQGGPFVGQVRPGPAGLFNLLEKSAKKGGRNDLRATYSGPRSPPPARRRNARARFASYLSRAAFRGLNKSTQVSLERLFASSVPALVLPAPLLCRLSATPNSVFPWAYLWVSMLISV